MKAYLIRIDSAYNGVESQIKLVYASNFTNAVLKLISDNYTEANWTFHNLTIE